MNSFLPHSCLPPLIPSCFTPFLPYSFLPHFAPSCLISLVLSCLISSCRISFRFNPAFPILPFLVSCL
jgi:hypothetical protein